MKNSDRLYLAALLPFVSVCVMSAGPVSAGRISTGSISRGNTNGCADEGFTIQPSTARILVRGCASFSSLTDLEDQLLGLIDLHAGPNLQAPPVPAVHASRRTFDSEGDCSFYDFDADFYLLFDGLTPGGSYYVSFSCPSPGQDVNLDYEIWDYDCTVPDFALGTTAIGLLWAELTRSRIERMDFGGNRTLLHDDLLNLRAIDVDSELARIYWSRLGSVGRSELDGSGVVNIATSIVDDAKDVVVDEDQGHVYWLQTGRILRADRNGANPITITTAVVSPAFGLAFDDVRGRLYWTEQTDDRIRSCNLNGTNVQTVLGGLANPYGIEVDAQTNQLYWADVGSQRILRVDLDDASPVVQTLADNSDGILWVRHLALDLDDQKLYFTDFHARKIRRVSLIDFSTADIVSTDLWGVDGIALERGLAPPQEDFNVVVIDNATSRTSREYPFLDFGTVTAAGGTRTREIVVLDPLTPAQLRSTCPQFEIGDVVDLGSYFVVTLEYAPAAPGDHFGELYVEMPGNVVAPHARMLLSGSSLVCVEPPLPAHCRYPGVIPPGGNGTGASDTYFLNAPDDISRGLDVDQVELFFECGLIYDGPGSDFNVYERDSTDVEFSRMDVQVSQKGILWFSVKSSEAPGVDIPGDQYHNNASFFRSYDLASAGLADARYVRVVGTDATSGGFDLDAVGAIHIREDCDTNGVYDGCELTSSSDLDGSQTLDACDLDCDADGVPDQREIQLGAPDCNGNGVPDACENDCDDDGVIDACEAGAQTLPAACRFPMTLLSSPPGLATAPVLGPPDGAYLGVGGERFIYQLDCSLVIDGPGSDFNVYEVIGGALEFGKIEVSVSDTGLSWFAVTDSEAPAAAVEGAEAYNDLAWARSYDLSYTGLAYARYIRIEGDSDNAAGGGTDFDLDAVGLIHATADLNGDGEWDVCQAGVSTDAIAPRRFFLDAATPNPFNPSTTIRFELPAPSHVDLNIYDVAGRRVRSLVAGEAYPPGRFEAVWTGRDDRGQSVASGVYIYELRAGELRATRRMVLLR